LRIAINDLNTVLNDVNETGLVTDLDAAVSTIATAAENIETATRNLPQITADLEELTARASELELQALVTSARDTLEAIDTLISTEDAIALPATLNGSLEEIRGLIAEIREGGAVENLTGTLQAANEAARAIEVSVQDFPALAERANRWSRSPKRSSTATASGRVSDPRRCRPFAISRMPPTR